MKENCIDICELQQMLKESMENAFPERFWVCAEIASLSVKGNGHCYMDLCRSRDGRMVAQIRAIAWSSVFRQISMCFSSTTGTVLQPGQNVMFLVSVQYSPLYGLSLIIDDVNPEFTLGDAEAKRRQTREKLEKEGLMDLQKELVLPPLPYSLAVISAQDAAGYRDFMRHLHENPEGYCFRTELFSAPMQGEGCAGGIAAAISEVEASSIHFDAVLILRGGGGKLDLSCYDDYVMCKAIARCRIPVLTAIGHDQDVHLCDAVAYDSVKTPTALADCFLDFYASADARLDAFQQRLSAVRSSRLTRMEAALSILQARLDAADPAKLLERGYILVLDAGGHPLKSVSTCAEGDGLTLMLSDGKLRVKVDTVEKRDVK